MPHDPLSRYWKVLKGEVSARYLICRRTRIEADLSLDTATLWNIHASQHPNEDSEGNISLLDLKAEIARRILEDCTLCERNCGANRLAGAEGHCGVLEARISSEFLHMGEEPDLWTTHNTQAFRWYVATLILRLRAAMATAT